MERLLIIQATPTSAFMPEITEHLQDVFKQGWRVKSITSAAAAASEHMPAANPFQEVVSAEKEQIVQAWVWFAVVLEKH